MKKVIVISGPTASGKTSLSTALAKHLKTEIINGDSIQMYKELNIGSAKIKEDEMNGVKHHLLDFLNLGEPYTIYSFQQDGRKLIKDLNFPLIVGGSGLYIKSLLYNYELKKTNKEKDLSKYSDDNLINRLLKLDPNIDIDLNNRHRLERAYLLALEGDFRSNKRKKDEPLYEILTIYLDIDRKVLKERLYLRLDIMIEEGFIEEAKGIYDSGHDLNIIGYRELNKYFDGTITLEEAKEQIINASMRLAKKQKTYFKNQMDVVMFDALQSDLINKVKNKVDAFLEG